MKFHESNTLSQAKLASLVFRICLISLGLMMSFNVSAKRFALQSDLDEEITNRTSADNNLQSQINSINQSLPLSHTIGEQYQGGKIFWIDDTGQHGLIAALGDQTGGAYWSHGVYRTTGATGDGIGAGRMNTALIIATQIGDPWRFNFAAKVAADYKIQDDGVTACTGSASETCYGDWYLPSKMELNLLFQVKDSVGGFAEYGGYWSSTEISNSYAWFHNNTNEVQNPKGLPYRVRAIRPF